MVKELEARVQQLTGEAENSNLQRQKLVQEKLELERCYQITCTELQEVKARYCLKSNSYLVWLQSTDTKSKNYLPELITPCAFNLGRFPT